MPIEGKPPWIYSFYIGTAWSIIVFAIIFVGLAVFLIIHFKKGNTRIKWLALGVALFCLLSYTFYLLYVSTI